MGRQWVCSSGGRVHGKVAGMVRVVALELLGGIAVMNPSLVYLIPPITDTKIDKQKSFFWLYYFES
jgi:hypothetical protein